MTTKVEYALMAANSYAVKDSVTSLIKKTKGVRDEFILNAKPML